MRCNNVRGISISLDAFVAKSLTQWAHFTLRGETDLSVLYPEPAPKDNVKYNVITQIDLQQKKEPSVW